MFLVSLHEVFCSNIGFGKRIKPCFLICIGGRGGRNLGKFIVHIAVTDGSWKILLELMVFRL